MSRSHPRPRTKVTFVQLLTALSLFVALSIMGGFLVAGLALPAVTVAGNAASGSAELFEELPEELAAVSLPQQSNIYDRTGKHLLATFYEQNRVVVPLEEISPWLQNAVVSIEDKRFWLHHGVDGEGLLRAAYVNLTSPDSPGASTLTQQLVKNTLLQKAILSEDDDALAAATEVSMTRKIREWRLALALEENLDREYGTECDPDDPKVDCGKEQVLEQYLNIAQFGANTYGVEAAAQLYFSKSAADLNAIEAATIAGITQNPSKWDPIRYPENAKARRDTVLYQMYLQDWLTEAEYDEYSTIPVEQTLDVSNPKFSCVAAQDAPFFCDYVTKIIRKDDVFNQEGAELTGAELLSLGGLDVVTTLDLDKQKAANAALEEALPADDPSGWAMALVSLDPDSGEILAMSQNREFDPSEEGGVGTTAINYAVDYEWGGSSGFSPGSTFKPVILTNWLQSGHSLNETVDGSKQKYDPYSWNASCLDGPATLQWWEPGNVEGARQYQQTVLFATANSVNTAYVNMTNKLDLCEIRDTAELLGFHRADGKDFEVNPTIALGTQNASPLTMAQVAQVFANEGVRCDPIAILSVTDANGKSLAVPPQSCERVIDKEIADGVAYAMQEVMKNGSGRYVNLADGRPAAGKTGTAQKNAHTWFMGYTPNLVATVWLGNPDYDESGQGIVLNGVPWANLYGSSVAAPTWKAYMDQAVVDLPVESFDDPTSDILYGKPVPVPSIIGRTEEEAASIVSAAGFKLASSGSTIYSTQYAPGTIVAQSPSAYYKSLPGTTVSYSIATDQLPSWYTKWPKNWDPTVAPDDWWGSSWPPAEFSTNPPAGWPAADTADDSTDANTDNNGSNNNDGNNSNNNNRNNGRNGG
ncbi:penicillin-binding protein [Demequina mangrovi]|uniref:Membrane carboxypeptidase (Penicillin-binding protein) n=1 Tax=Demequina mangrovi TaxID=1043493 RepID=A0A1H6VZW1_9MICO|nr:penicillin-binding protein [Demequina mangrovi]SEJ10199.1 Membrane carboxypeptidase (penicillin-binding protein) [Demequina mangrovi]